MSEAPAASIVAREETTPPRASNEAEKLRRQLRRLALDVHDGPMQSLIAAGYGLRDLQARRHVDGDAFSERLDGIAEELMSVERGLRDLILSLERGAEADRAAFEEIVATEIERFRNACPATVEQNVTRDELPDSHSQEIAIRSIVGEALSNVAKHAGADVVTIRLQADSTGIRLEITDDGCGFDPSSVPEGCIGLTSMRERLQFLGGSLGIDSHPGGPTRVSATIPRWRGEPA